MFFYINGFYLSCKVKDLRSSLKKLGDPNIPVKDLISQRLH